jgi:hypothetical protein
MSNQPPMCRTRDHTHPSSPSNLRRSFHATCHHESPTPIPNTGLSPTPFSQSLSLPPPPPPLYLSLSLSTQTSHAALRIIGMRSCSWCVARGRHGFHEGRSQGPISFPPLHQTLFISVPFLVHNPALPPSYFPISPASSCVLVLPLPPQ